MTLSAVKFNAARPKANPYKLSDASGLYLLAQPTDGRLWRMNYRFDGKQRTLSFGPYPDEVLGQGR